MAGREPGFKSHIVPSEVTAPKREDLKSEDAIDQDLLREQLSGVTIDCFFATHVDAEDAHKLGEIINRADIVVFEAVNWSDVGREMINQISQFDTSDPAVKQIVDNITNRLIEDGASFFAEKIRLIAGTGKPILLSDLPRNHPVTVTFNELRSKSRQADTQAWERFFDGKYDEMITLETQAAALDYKGKRLREKFIIEAMASQIKEAKDANPDLANKDDVHVLMEYGSSHKTIFHDLKRAGVSTTATMGYSLDLLPYSEEIKRRLYFKKEVPEELYARCLLSFMFVGTIKSANPHMNTEQALLVTRKSLDRLSAEDIRELSSQLGKIKSEQKKWAAMNAFLSDKGAIIPDTDEEIRAILGPEYKQYTRLATAA